jgi:hypothetical protein
MPLAREEYVEQAYFFRTLRERMLQNMSTQELLGAIRQELLATTHLPHAIDFMASELRLTGGFATAMAKLPHYFTPFQAFVVAEAERSEGKFDFRVGLEILEREAEYRANNASPQGIFFYQFEAICRNRLGYERGLDAVAGDALYDQDWRDWIFIVRQQIGLIDLSDLIYIRSDLYRKRQEQHQEQNENAADGTGPEKKRAPSLFGEKEGRIAMANRRKDPLYLFAALSRHLGYPTVPRTLPEDSSRFLVPALQRRIERLESRIKLLEEETRGGINISRFYAREQNSKPQDSDKT